MKIFYAAFFVVITAGLFSCQKELVPNVPGSSSDTTVIPPATVSNLLKTYAEDYTSGNTHQVETYNVNYDASNRLASLVSQTVPGDKFVYTFVSPALLTLEIFSSNVLTIHGEFYLNSLGLPDSTFQYNDTNDSTTQRYIYNSANKPEQFREYDYSLITGAVLSATSNYTYDAEGNLVREANNTSVRTTDYFDIADNIISFPGTPLQPAKLVKTETVEEGSITSIIHHTYTFDSNGRVLSEKQTVEGSTEVAIKSYTYIN